MNNGIFEFSSFNKFYLDSFTPITFYGKIEKNNAQLSCNYDDLEKEFSNIEKAIGFIKDNDFIASKIEYHLSKFPNINAFHNNELFNTADLYQIKKILINYKSICKLLKGTKFTGINLSFTLSDLVDILSIGANNSEEGFYLSDEYSKKLLKLRKEIRKKEKDINAIKEAYFNNLLSKYNLDFRFRDFIILSQKEAEKINSELIYLEPYDHYNIKIKPIFKKDYFDLYYQKESLIEKEQQEEIVVRKSLSKEILTVKNTIESYIKKITKLDILFAKARLAIKYNMSKPILFNTRSKIEIKNGRLLYLEDKCAKLGTQYQPLTAEFDKRNCIINGANMGGKTVLLQTLSFMQVLTQMGFFVPADYFKTTLFESISYVGETNVNDSNGLSSFGLEIHNFTEAYNNHTKKTFIIIDEFARTTNSKEAYILLSAILKTFSENSKIYSFLSTHFIDLPVYKNCSFYKMKGLNYKEYKSYYNKQRDYGLEEKIKLINNFMDYQVEKNTKQAKEYDALKIAEILGFDKKILARAQVMLDN